MIVIFTRNDLTREPESFNKIPGLLNAAAADVLPLADKAGDLW